jgi:quinol monooxygenase YgiN
MKPGCTLMVTLRAKPERRRELEGILLEMVVPTRREPGCVDYHLHVSPEDPNTFIFYESWRTRQDLEAHLKLPHLVPLLSRKDELLAGPTEERIWDMLSDHPG